MFNLFIQLIDLLNVPITIFFIIYALLQVCLFITAFFSPGRKNSSPLHRPPVSIIIPFRNEERQLGTLLDSLKKLRYKAPIEIVFIDDGSDDDSKNIVDQYANNPTHTVQLLSNRFDPSRQLTSKQQALEAGITAASYEVIALTDADMALSPEWLDRLVGALDDTTALVFGHTIITPSGKLFPLLQSLQLEFLFSIAVLFHDLHIPGSCMGNNLLIRKSAYLSCGGQTAIGYSIAEDQALLHRFRRCGHSIGTVSPFHPTAMTPPQTTIDGFIQQISRWASGGFSGNRILLFFGVLFGLHVFVTCILCTGILHRTTSMAGLGSFCIAWLVTAVMFTRNRSKVSPLLFPLLYPMILMETITLFGVFASGKRLRWKERSI
jgi:1,2-diacylglycerol 3-beta-glucosyltransferase